MQLFFEQQPFPLCTIVEYCSPLWCRSVHTIHIDNAINVALCIETGCLHPTPLDNLPILAGIQHAELCERQIMIYFSSQALVPGHLLYHHNLEDISSSLSI